VEHQVEIPLLVCVPFVVLLLLIAIMPLMYPHWWEKNRNKAIVAAVMSLPVFIYLLLEIPEELLITFKDYLSFIILLASLFIISGGILLKGDLKATPAVNTAFLAIGALIANVIGTTGASMLLIRPMLRTNSERKHTFHIPIFFIFIVSNIAGSLTPLGDPPLFLGYLRGVPFTWTFTLLPQWLTAVGILLAVFFIWDSLAFRKEEFLDIVQDIARKEPLRISGAVNLFFLLMVVMAVFKAPTPYRELTMIAATVLSLAFTKKEIREGNGFTFNPISEVAILFAGIFITMVPLLALLGQKGASLGITQPWQFFWLSGGLSSFLDNAPTYLTFTSLAESVTRANSLGLPVIAGVRTDLLTAVSCGAVFMGANTYIGNGPNFMVKAITEEQGMRVPHFFQYMVYSGLILIPIFIVITFIFFR
jgi:Na+/H+ antiporter NhaD/arsenite permease-like protein